MTISREARQQTPAPFALRQFNRKIPAPSLIMSPSDGLHYRCPWIGDSITVHSDGNVTCGMDDPHGQRSFGNIYSQPIEEIFRNPEYRNLQRKLWKGHRCRECGLYEQVTSNFGHDVPERPPLPITLIVEPTVRCNIRCNNSACNINNDSQLRTRDADLLEYGAFVSLVDQLKAKLQHVYFFNYGDPFVHARADDMLLYLRESCPDVEIVTSTNGIPLAKPDRARRIVESRVDHMVFTIGGITPESYSRYHGSTDVASALKGMKNILDAKRELGFTKPKVVWRYLLFRWNDSDQEIEAALEMAKEYGVDQFVLYLTHLPIEGTSFRFAPSTPNFAKYRRYIDNALGYQHVCGIPQPNDRGFFPVEFIEGLGRLRWTGWRARIEVNTRDEWIHLSVTTNRLAARKRLNSAFIVTPWATYKIPLVWMQWQEVTIRVPDGSRWNGPYAVEIVTFDHWFPAEDYGSPDPRSLPDPRCLGVLFKVDEERISYVEALRRWERTKSLPALTLEDEGRLAAVDRETPPALVDYTTARFGFDTGRG